MKTISIALSCLLSALIFSLASCHRQQEKASVNDNGIDSLVYYYYDYPLDESHSDDNVIELAFKDGVIVDLFFWGSSDEFDPAREGYLPGYTVLRGTQIKHNGNAFSFLLDARNSLYFSNAVDVDVHASDSTLLQQGYYLWSQEQRFFQDTSRYKGTFHQDGFVIDKRTSKYMHFADRRFVKMNKEEIKKIDRRLPEEQEKFNRYSIEESEE